MKWTRTPTKRNALNVNTILKCLQVVFRITSRFVLMNFEVKYLAQHIGDQNKYFRGNILEGKFQDYNTTPNK